MQKPHNRWVGLEGTLGWVGFGLRWVGLVLVELGCLVGQLGGWVGFLVVS